MAKDTHTHTFKKITETITGSGYRSIKDEIAFYSKLDILSHILEHTNVPFIVNGETPGYIPAKKKCLLTNDIHYDCERFILNKCFNKNY